MGRSAGSRAHSSTSRSARLGGTTAATASGKAGTSAFCIFVASAAACGKTPWAFANGWRPASSSHVRMPAAYTSDAGEGRSPRRTSGAA